MSRLQERAQALHGNGGAAVDISTVLRSPTDGRSGGTAPLTGPGVEQRAQNG